MGVDAQLAGDDTRIDLRRRSSIDGCKSIEGVRASRIDNQRMAESIANALRDRVTGGDISIEYKDGVAVLGGTVTDPKMKKLATSLTEQVANVSRVENRMTVTEKKRSSWIVLWADPRQATLSRRDSRDDGQNRQQRIQQVNGTIIPRKGPT